MEQYLWLKSINHIILAHHYLNIYIYTYQLIIFHLFSLYSIFPSISIPSYFLFYVFKLVPNVFWKAIYLEKMTNNRFIWILQLCFLEVCLFLSYFYFYFPIFILSHILLCDFLIVLKKFMLILLNSIWLQLLN